MSNWSIDWDTSSYCSDQHIVDVPRFPAVKRPSPKGNGFSAKVARTLAKIDRKAKELREAGVDASELKKIKSRLSFAWCDEPKERHRKTTAVTTWRLTVARRAYAHVQNANDHLLLPVILAVAPSECSTPVFKQVLPILVQNRQYTSYRLSLGLEVEDLLKSLALEGRFYYTPRYLAFVQALFPQHEPVELDTAPSEQEIQIPNEQEQAREIEQAYSLVRIEDLPAFLHSLIPGVIRSEKIEGEMMGGSRTSNCATILIPLNVKDCVCHIVLDRDTAMESINKYRLSSITSG